MTWTTGELDDLIGGDVDDVTERARRVPVRERALALRDALRRLESEGEVLPRLKLLVFIQTCLAMTPDGKLAARVADRAAQELSRVVISAVEPADLKLPALEALALLFLKAKELTDDADQRVRLAFRIARESKNPHMSAFAETALTTGGVLSRRRLESRYRLIHVSAMFAAGAALGAGAAAVMEASKRRARKKTASKDDATPHRRNAVS